VAFLTSLASITFFCALVLPTSLALADPPPPAVPSAGTPLAPRVSHPDKALPSPNFAGLAAKVGLALIVVGGALYAYRRQAAKPPSVAPTLSIVARASLGLRNELVVVEVDGQRLLLGVTPSAINLLNVLTDATAVHDEAEVDEAPQPEAAVSVAQLIENRLGRRGSPLATIPSPPKSRARERDEAIQERTAPPPAVASSRPPPTVGDEEDSSPKPLLGTPRSAFRGKARSATRAMPPPKEPPRVSPPSDAPIERQVQGLSRARRVAVESPLALGDEVEPPGPRKGTS
jgi:flagellar protein FliO/FliZ